MSITNTEIVRLAKLLLASEAAQSPDHPDHSRAIKLDDEADREFANLDMYDSALVVMARMLFSGHHYYVNGSDPETIKRASEFAGYIGATVKCVGRWEILILPVNVALLTPRDFHQGGN